MDGLNNFGFHRDQITDTQGDIKTAHVLNWIIHKIGNNIEDEILNDEFQGKTHMFIKYSIVQRRFFFLNERQIKHAFKKLKDLEIIETKEIWTDFFERSGGDKKRIQAITLTKKYYNKYLSMCVEHKCPTGGTKMSHASYIEKNKIKNDDDKSKVDANPILETQSQAKQENPEKESSSFFKLADIYNRKIKKTALSKFELTYENRARVGKALEKLNLGPEKFGVYIDKALSSPYILGQTGAKYSNTFEWLLNPTVYQELMNGKYDANKKPSNPDLVGQIQAKMRKHGQYKYEDAYKDLSPELSKIIGQNWTRLFHKTEREDIHYIKSLINARSKSG